MLRNTLLIAAAVTVATTAVFFYAGLFDPLSMRHESKGAYHLAYKEYRGPYRSVPFVVNTIFRYARDTLKLPTATPFALFYDRPDTPGNDSLRSIGGVIVDSVPHLRPDLRNGMFGKTEAVVGTFRMRGFFSLAVGSYKFYSALPGYLEKKKLHQHGPAMEIYDSRQHSIFFVVPTDSPDVPTPLFTDHK